MKSLRPPEHSNLPETGDNAKKTLHRILIIFAGALAIDVLRRVCVYFGFSEWLTTCMKYTEIFAVVVDLIVLGVVVIVEAVMAIRSWVSAARQQNVKMEAEVQNKAEAEAIAEVESVAELPQDDQTGK